MGASNRCPTYGPGNAHKGGKGPFTVRKDGALKCWRLGVLHAQKHSTDDAPVKRGIFAFPYGIWSWCMIPGDRIDAGEKRRVFWAKGPIYTRFVGRGVGHVDLNCYWARWDDMHALAKQGNQVYLKELRDVQAKMANRDYDCWTHIVDRRPEVDGLEIFIPRTTKIIS